MGCGISLWRRRNKCANDNNSREIPLTKENTQRQVQRLYNQQWALTHNVQESLFPIPVEEMIMKTKEHMEC